jgi:hypothetical protein
MYISDLFESNERRLVVVYPGRFQPFHLGHAGVFAKLQAKFGRDNCYIITTPNVKIDNKNPFNATEKVALMHSAGITDDRIKLVSQPYSATFAAQEIGFDPRNTVVIYAIGAPDRDRLQVDAVYTTLTPTGRPSRIPAGKQVGDAKEFKTYPGNLENCVTMAEGHSYVVVVSEIKVPFEYNGQTYDISHGTQCRDTWNMVRNDPKASAAFLTKLYGRSTPELVHIFNQISTGAPVAEPESLKKKVELKKVKLPRAKPQELAEDEVDYGQQHAIPRKNITYHSPVYGQPDRPDPEKLKIIDQVARSADRVLPDTQTSKVDGFRERAVEILNTVQDQGLRRVTADWIRAGLKKPEWQGVILGILMAYVARGTMAGATAAQLSPADTTIALEFMLPTIGNIIGFRWLSNQTWAKSIKAGVLSGLVGAAAAASTKAFFEVGGTGVVATQGQAQDPRYSMSLTKDVHPGQINKNLRAFDL